MMPTDRFERRLPVLLTELAEPRTPDYLDDLLVETAHTSQRPSWTFLGRWLPFVDTARQSVVAPRVPWRSIGLAVLLAAIVLALLAALIAGSRPRVPAPFGPARAGLVAYSSAGDIYTVDPATDASTTVVAGPETDLEPQWSRDGTRLVFERRLDRALGSGLLFVARADGTDLVRITPRPVPVITSYAFSPDGREVLITASPNGPKILIAAADGSQIRELDVGRPATQAAWRPPNGAEILFVDGSRSNGYAGLYAVSPVGGEVRTILEPVIGRSRDMPKWSSDGSRIAYIEWVDSDHITARIHIIAADGTGDRLMPMPPDVLWEVARSWSNDGTRLLAVRGYDAFSFQNSRAVVIPVDGSGYGVEIAYPIDAQCCSIWEWAPDDRSILGTPTDLQGQPLAQVLLDPVTGTSTTVPWTTTSQASWQRLAK